MKSEHIFKISFCISLIGILAGAFLKIIHSPFVELLLQLFIVCYLVFAAVVIYAILGYNKIGKTQKFMWTIGIILFGALTGILHLYTGRKRNANNLTNGILTLSLYEN